MNANNDARWSSFNITLFALRIRVTSRLQYPHGKKRAPKIINVNIHSSCREWRQPDCAMGASSEVATKIKTLTCIIQ
jgi:hypothetical protein